jgi:uncharacterized protein (DUF305 family)
VKEENMSLIKKSAALSVVAVVVSLSMPAVAQQSPQASKGYMEAMSSMQAKMPKEMIDPDTDFARMMIPHHQGAIDMAKVELKYGKDPVFRKMAEKMIEDQQKEVAELQKRLKENGK